MSDDPEPASRKTALAPLQGAWSALHRKDNKGAVPASRCAYYCRFSDDGQKESSIERQVEYCDAYARFNGLVPLEGRHIFADRGKSGVFTVERAALAAVLEKIRNGEINKLLLENLDRLARDLLIVMEIHREATKRGVEIHVTSGTFTGRVDDVGAVINGLFAQKQRERMLQITGIGRWRAAMKGLSVGLVPYGYRSTGVVGEIEIYEPEAEIVRLIFKWFAEGLSPSKIAFALNAKDVPSAKGGKWGAAPIYGQAADATGILRRALYVGIYLFGRFKMITSIENGRKKRRYEVRPRKDWVELPVPELAIVDEELWTRVQQRLKAEADLRASQGKWKSRERHSKYSTLVFHGAYECSCGSRLYTAFSHSSTVRRLLCPRAVHYKSCPNTRTLTTNAVEVEILREIRDNMLNADAHELFVEQYLRESRIAEAETRTRRVALEHKIAELSALIRGSFKTAIQSTRHRQDLEDARDEWEEERSALEEQLVSLPPPMTVPKIDPESIGSMKDQIDALIVKMPFHAKTVDDHLLVAALRKLVTKVVVGYIPDDEGYRLDITASLAGLAEDKSAALASGIPSRDFHRICPRPPNGYANACERDEYYRKLAAEGTYALSDHDWQLVEHITEGLTKASGRLLVDAALFYLRTDLGLNSLPPPFDQCNYYFIRQFVVQGLWRGVYDVLLENDSKAVAGLDTARFDKMEVNYAARQAAETPDRSQTR
ncbi:hypothetical protein MFUR16E_21615 [Methylobacterium fujisawaense]|uniref:recombinase family protein n=1 Tax=Methylobacterium fujisawaense TaxID=107400 RepID=UPI002F2E7142